MTHTLEAGAGGSGFRASITKRVAAHEVLTTFFRAHDDAPHPSALARFFGRDILTSMSRPLYADVRAALAIAHALDSLDNEWSVFHAVPMATRENNIDHLLIGPGGVFALTVANHSDESVRVAQGSFEVAGSRHNHIRNSGFEVGYVERLLGAAVQSQVTATGVVVVVDPKSVVIHGVPRDVAIVPSDNLVAWLHQLPMRLSAMDVEQLVRAAECPATWIDGVMPVGVSTDLHARFLDVVRYSRRAENIRRLWIVAAITVIAAAFSLWACALVMFE